MSTPDPLKLILDRLASELVGARNAYTLLRPNLDFDGQEKAMAHLCSLEAQRDEAQRRWENSATPGQREEVISLLNHVKITKTEKSVEMMRLRLHTMESASVLIVSLKLDINERMGYAVFPEVVARPYAVEPTYAVVAEVFRVEPVAA